MEAKPLLLLVDDEPTNIHALMAALGDEYEMKIAICGEDALKIAEEPEKPDLILLDVLMPGLDGYEVCRRLKKNEETRSIPVIFITAQGEPEMETRGFEAGGVDYISKPLNPLVTKVRVDTHVKLKQAQDQLVRIANQDGLTKLSNRRHFDEYLEKEWRRNFRDKTPLALIMSDVDHFKKYNDTYGHQAGDECLVKVAGVLKGVLHRPGDLAARYGGEEFVGILSGTNADSARLLAESFRQGVEVLAIPHSSHPIGRVTVSCGVYAVTPNATSSIKELLSQADKNLYKAKESGRNTVASS
jgi:diguanylate cyclase (GGDEF)-like protein